MTRRPSSASKQLERTAAEVLARLSTDPAFTKAQAHRDVEGGAVARELSRAEAALVHDLTAAGEAVDSVWDLVNTTRRYPAAVPVALMD